MGSAAPCGADPLPWETPLKCTLSWKDPDWAKCSGSSPRNKKEFPDAEPHLGGPSQPHSSPWEGRWVTPPARGALSWGGSQQETNV